MAASRLELKSAKMDRIAKLDLSERLQVSALGSFPWDRADSPVETGHSRTVVASYQATIVHHHLDDGHDHDQDGAEGLEFTSSTSTCTTEDSTTSNVDPILSVSASGDQGIDGLLKGVRWADGSVTYCDPDSVDDYTSPYPRELVSADGTVLISQLSAQQLDAARFALDADPYGQLTAASSFSAEGFANLTVSYAGSGSGDGTLALVNRSTTTTASAYYPNDSLSGSGGDAFFGGSGKTPVVGNYDWKTVLHELGHALGLKHGQDTSVYGAMPSHLDSMEYSVMTYRSYVGATGGYTNESWGYAQTYMMYDIAALQSMYGADFSANEGDTTYKRAPTSGDTLIDGDIAISPGDGTTASNRIFLTIWDGGGTDTYGRCAHRPNARLAAPTLRMIAPSAAPQMLSCVDPAHGGDPSLFGVT